MNFQDFERYFSASRVSRYLLAARTSESRAMQLYKANLVVSQALHPLLGVLEVVLRNRLNDVLSAHFSDNDWIINQVGGFMSHPTITNDFLKKEVIKAQKRLYKSGTSITSGKIIAEQTLGFWTELFAVHHYKLLKGKPIQIFPPRLPRGYGRKEVWAELDSIRRLRNRINHNEPICFSGTTIDFTDTRNIYTSLLKILRLIDSNIPTFISDIDEVQKAIDSATRI